MRKWSFLYALILAAVILAGCGTNPLAGTVTVVLELPELAGMNAGSNVVDQGGVNRAVSDLMVLDDAGAASVVLHADGQDVVFPGGTILTVHCTVWVGPQSDLDTRFTAIKEITISGDQVVAFVPEDNTLR